MTKTKTAPFKADHVGSLLRPDNLHEARKDYADGKITAEQLREVETKEIKRIVDKQIEVGLDLVTDGEFRDRKSTRLNSSHVSISYAVFCLKKKNIMCRETDRNL